MPWIGHIRPWKKLGHFKDVKKRHALKRSQLAYPNTLHSTCSIFEHPWNDPNFLPPGGHSHGRHPCQVWTIFDIVCKLRHVRPFFGLFSPRKLQKMQILSQTKKTCHDALNWSYKAMKKIGAISRMSKNNVLSDEPSGLPEHLRWTSYICGHPWSYLNFCYQVDMTR
jgi:hypothetical protein